MKFSILTLLFSFSFIICHAQQKDYKPLIDSFFQYAQNNFKDIAEEPNDTSVFSPAKIKADIGNIKIARYPNVITLNWTIPLNISDDIQKAVQEYILTRFSDTQHFKVVTDGTKKEGYKTTNVYAFNGEEKPLVIFRTILYKSGNKKGIYTITVYGK